MMSGNDVSLRLLFLLKRRIHWWHCSSIHLHLQWHGFYLMHL
jgi:hypothetical protein